MSKRHSTTSYPLSAKSIKIEPEDEDIILLSDDTDDDEIIMLSDEDHKIATDQKAVKEEPKECIYEVHSSYTNRIKKYNIVQHISKITISNANVCLEEELEEIFEKIIDEGFQRAQKEGLNPKNFGILFRGSGLIDPIVIPIRSRDQNSTDAIIAEINKLDQSDKKINFLNSDISATITVTSDPSGAGFLNGFNPKESFDRNNNQRIEIRNNDSYCLFYALELSRLTHDPQLKKGIEKGKINTTIDRSKTLTYSQLHYIYKKVHRQQEIAMKLLTETGIPQNLPSYGIEHIKKIQEYYDETYPGLYRIVLIDDSKSTKPLYVGPIGREFEVHIILEGQHYTALKSIAAYYNCRKYCADCGYFYDRDSTHSGRCITKCLKCSNMGRGPCQREMNVCIYCEKCMQTFFNKKCFELHKKNGTCGLYHKCKECKTTYQKRMGKHICGEKYCTTCHVYHTHDRGCFITPLKKKEQKPQILLAFDLETTQDDMIRDDIYEHDVNAVSARWCCTICADKGLIGEESTCRICMPLKYQKTINAEDGTCEESTFKRIKYWSMYKHDDPQESFVDWLLKAFGSKQSVIVYSHNGGRFDNHFILRSIFQRKLRVEKLIMTGNKIYQMKTKGGRKYAKLTFRDSYMLMQVPLDALKKTFGLTTQPKPFFPYLFNTRANMHTELDHLPPMETYIPNGMMPDKYEKFITWYNENKNTPFSLRRALKEYVENDTAILLEAIVKMREILIGISKGYDPLISSCTIAGIAMKTYRALFLKEKEMAIVPEQGYERVDRASDIAIKMLEWISEKENIKIQHAGNGREKQFKIYDMLTNKSTMAKVDGYVQEQDRIIEILGCYYHGCPKCTKPSDKGANGNLATDNYNTTMNRIDLLRQQASIVDIIWECDINKQLSKDKTMKEFFTDCNTKGRIEPRDAYFGGLTCAFSMKELADADHELSMFDIVSLYPYCNYVGPYPKGHPEIIVPEMKEVNWTKPEDVPYRGLIKARVIPPKGLYLPQIPIRIPGDERLLFCLCIPCAKALKDENKKQFETYNCPHTEKQRAFTTTLSDIELKEALMHGYRVTHVYRAWNYKEWSDSLFNGYVKMFVKLKVENSEFPEVVKTEEEKRRFAQAYKEILDIDIDVSKVALNPGLRYIAKLLLNSLWGKFSQRNSLAQTTIIRHPSEWYELYFNSRIEICQIIPMNQDVLRVTYQNKMDFVEENETSNIVVSLFTTSIARLKLFSYLRLIERTPGCKICYVDTDSVLFKHPKGMKVLPIGQFLGEMTKEYADYDIIEFIAGGPKQYALMLRHKITGKIKYVVKLRGITLNHENVERIKYEKFKEMIEKYGTCEEESIECAHDRLGPEQSSRIMTKKLIKKYKVVNNKGLISKDFTLYPFGFK